MRPLIAVTCGRREAGPTTATATRIRPPRPEAFLNESIIQRLRDAGAVVAVFPPGDASAVEAYLPLFKGVVVTGGAFDIHPRHYGQAVEARIDDVDDDRTDLELKLARYCVAHNVPFLGICGGMQALAVALGGTLIQDIRTQRPDALQHEQPTSPDEPWHALEVVPPYDQLIGPGANSTHHQAVDHPGPFQVIARAPDGVIEAIALPDHPFCIGVQWHPEWLDGRLFDAFVGVVRGAT